MAKTKPIVTKTITERPSLTPEGREAQLISLAVDLAEKQLREGTASSQVITHFLKLGCLQAQADLEKTRAEKELLLAKIDALEGQKKTDELYSEALAAMRLYSGTE